MIKKIIAIILVKQSLQDLPIHCLQHQIAGKWKFDLGPVKMIGDGLLPCGHKEPDDENDSYLAGFDDFKIEQSVTHDLQQDYKVFDKGDEAGNWTMVYDEGFNVITDKLDLFVFLKYVPQSSNVEDSQSDCQNTLIGWYKNLQTKERGCFKGSKGDSKLTTNAHQDTVVQPKGLDSMYLQINHKNYDHQHFVDQINKNKNSLWEASTYSEEFKGLTFAQVNTKAGRKHKVNKSKRFSQKNPFAIFAQTRNLNNANTFSALPKEFSWKEYVGEAIQQKDCGSCYAIATVEMLNTRLKIKYNEDIRLSVQQILDCNYYNQGCEGGYGYLVSKFASEVEILPSECKKYQAYDGTCSNLQCDPELQKVSYKVDKFGYIGGGYMKSTEENIMKEIMENGPVVLSFEPAYDFMYYRKGIYKSMKDSDYNNIGYQIPLDWEKVDHSVMCYGWGEKDGIKYWECLNSWGRNWGQNGHFKIIKGIDDSHIESMAEFSMPYKVIKGSSTSFLKRNVSFKKSNIK